MTSAPPKPRPGSLEELGVTIFTPSTALAEAKKNVSIAIFGDSKTGKTHFAVRSQGPRYIAYLDPNSTLMAHMHKAAQEKGSEFPMFDAEEQPLFFPLFLPPINITNLTEAAAQEYLDKLTKFARIARNQAEARAAKGEFGGTFIVDGMTMLKGYAEKAIVGQSPTLGERTERGGKGVSTFEYAKSNTWLRSFISDFVGSELDLIVIWEGTPVYADVISETGAKKSVKTGKFKPTMPDKTSFAINALVETVMVQEQVVDPTTRKVTGYRVVPYILIKYNSFDKDYTGGLMPAMSFKQLKGLFLSDLPEEQIAAVKASVGQEVQRVNQDIVIDSSLEADETPVVATT